MLYEVVIIFISLIIALYFVHSIDCNEAIGDPLGAVAMGDCKSQVQLDRFTFSAQIHYYIADFVCMVFCFFLLFAILDHSEL